MKKHYWMVVGFGLILMVAGTTLTGCGTKAQREAEKQEKELSDARWKWIESQTQHRPLDKKIPLIAIKYGVSENVLHDFIKIYEIEDQSFVKVFTATNITELKDMEMRLANLPSISNTVYQIAQQYGMKPEVIASLLYDYYSWSSHENVSQGNCSIAKELAGD